MRIARRPQRWRVAPDTPASSAVEPTGTAHDVVCAALALLDTAQEAAPLVSLLAERGIAHGWQLGEMTESELRELTMTHAGWSMGEMLALRKVLAGGRRTGTATGTAATPSTSSGFEAYLNVAESASKSHLRAFNKVRVGISALTAGIHCMSPEDAKASMCAMGETNLNASMILGFTLWQMRVPQADSSYADLPAVINFLISWGFLTCLMTMLASMFLVMFTGLVPAERFRREPAFVNAHAAYLNHVICFGLPAQFICITVILLEAWHGQLQWYAVALTVICVVLWAIQAPQDINLQVEGHALSALHAPQWFRSMIGVKVNTRLVENAKRQRNSMADIYEDK